MEQWEVEKLRLTAFSKELIQLEDSLGLPGDLSTDNIRREVRDYEKFRLDIQINKERVDLNLFPPPQKISIGNLPESLEHFKMFKGFLEKIKSSQINRIAFGASVFHRTKDVAESNSFISSYLPFDVDPETKDFLYRVNKPIEYSGIEVNRVINLSSAQIVQAQFDLGNAKGRRDLSIITHASYLDIDINTSQHRKEAIPDLNDIWDKLIKEALSVFKNGANNGNATNTKR